MSPSPEPTPSPTSEQATPTGESTLLGKPAEEPKPVEEAKPEDKPAEKPPGFVLQDLKLPEGIKPDDPGIKEFVELAAADNLKTETAQKLFNMYTASVEGFAKANKDAWNAVTAGWTKELEADPEIGGTKLHTTVLPSISKMINEVAGDKLGSEVRKALDLTGAGNNPAMVRFFAKLAAAQGEGKFIQGSAPSGDKPAPGPNAMYPNLT